MGEKQECFIHDCARPSFARGWCDAHYRRWRRHGDPLAGGVTKGAALRWISDVALNHDGGDCLPWPFGTINDAALYGQVWVDGKNVLAHRHVCELARGTPPTPKHEAAHSCGNETCVNPGHLDWKTRAENEADKLLHGTHNRGERCANSKLSSADVREIRSLAATATHRQIAERYGVGRASIGKILNGENWGWLQ